MINNWTDYKLAKIKNKLPSMEMDYWLSNRAKAGLRDRDRAVEELLSLYGGLISNIAQKCLGRGCEFEDLIQSGKLGLLHALTKYDPNKSKFSTYLTPWVWQYCLRLIENTGRNIRLPNHIHETLQKILQLGIDLTVDELVDKINLPRTRIVSAIDGYYSKTLSIDDLTQYTYQQEFNINTSLPDVLIVILEQNNLNSYYNIFFDHFDAGISIENLEVKYKINKNDLDINLQNIVEHLRKYYEDYRYGEI
jgi:RNA polymerase sigma factor (sigma-70 family)